MEPESESVASQRQTNDRDQATAALIQQSRLSLPLIIRIPVAATLGFVGGFMLGNKQGGMMAGMRFRAENAHRFPTTATGWYLYHKTKNYKIALDSVKEGVRMGGKVSLWTSSFFLIESLIDEGRGVQDFVSTALAGLGVAGIFSGWNRFPLMMTMRTLQTGFYGGLAFGVLEDLLGLARGRRLRYVDFLLDTFGVGGRAPDEENT